MLIFKRYCANKNVVVFAIVVVVVVALGRKTVKTKGFHSFKNNFLPARKTCVGSTCIPPKLDDAFLD